jgi:hypothetical protein
MVRFALVGLIALATVASLSPGQHPLSPFRRHAKGNRQLRLSSYNLV